MNLFVVTGQFRSGTSAVAQVLQALRCPMAVAIAPPLDPINQFDWEDALVLGKLVASFERTKKMKWRPDDIKQMRMWFEYYIGLRIESAASFAKNTNTPINSIGVKSPYYAAFIPEIKAAIKGLNLKPQIIVCKRDETERIESMRRTILRFQHVDEVMDSDARIRKSLETVKPSLEVHLEELRAHPEEVVRDLAHIADQTCEKRIADAISVVRQETASCLG